MIIKPIKRDKKAEKEQAMYMQKIKIFDGDGKSRDERETCFPNMVKNTKRTGDGAR